MRQISVGELGAPKFWVQFQVHFFFTETYQVTYQIEGHDVYIPKI